MILLNKAYLTIGDSKLVINKMPSWQQWQEFFFILYRMNKWLGNFRLPVFECLYC